MNIQEESQKYGGNPFIRYALLAIGFLIFTFGEGMLTWKQTASTDAEGDVSSIELSIIKLNKEIDDAKDADDKKDLRDEIKDLEKDDMDAARLDAMEATVASKNGIWFFSMLSVLGATIMGLGLIVIATYGGSHEKVGSLVALALIILKL